MLDALRIIPTLTWYLNQHASENSKQLMNELLAVLHSSDVVFERVARAFDHGEDVEEEDLHVVRTVLFARIALEDALARVNDEHLDWFAGRVDEDLKPFEHALCMLGMDGDDLERQVGNNVFIDPDAWFGMLVRPSYVEAKQILDIALERIWERNAIDRLVATSGVSREKAEKCLDLAEQHLRNLYWKFSRQSWTPKGANRFEERCMWEHETWKETTAFWDHHSRPLKYRIVAVATEMLKTSDEKLARFEEYLRCSY
jgi:hypothetical protein